MKQDFFPYMLYYPGGKRIVRTLSCAFFTVLVIPLLLNFMTVDAWEDPETLCRVEFFAQLGNGALILFMMRYHLLNAFLQFRTNLKHCLGVAFGCALLGILAGGALLAVSVACKEPTLRMVAFDAIPLHSHIVLLSPGNLLFENPVFGLVCSVLLAPAVISCLYYVCVFAPVSGDRPRLAYLVVAFILLIPHLVNLFLFSPPAYELGLYAAQLVVHLIVCWGYQRTDTVYTPIVSLTVINLVGSGFFLWLQSVL